jgi:hypothetical protein
MYEQPDSPLTIGGVLDSGIKLFKVSFNRVVWLAIAAGFFSQIPGLMITTGVDPEGMPEFDAGMLIVLALTMVVSMIFFAAVIARIDATHRGTDLSVSQCFSVGLACLLPILGCAICYGIAVFVGSLLLLVPGLILMVSLMFGPYMVVVEKMGAIESLRESHRLVWGNWWRTAGILTIAGFLMMVAYTLFAFVVGMVMFVESDPAAMSDFSLTQMVFSSLFSGLITPLFYALILAIYYDLRLRHGGGDLAARIDAAELSA